MRQLKHCVMVQSRQERLHVVFQVAVVTGVVMVTRKVRSIMRLWPMAIQLGLKYTIMYLKIFEIYILTSL